MATTVTSYPAALAASRTRNGNRPLPAIRPRRIGRSSQVVGLAVLRALGGAPQDDATRRAPDEIEQVGHFRARERWVTLDLLERTRGIQLRLEEIPERALQFVD